MNLKNNFYVEERYFFWKTDENLKKGLMQKLLIINVHP